jgi:HD superfamily phosphodiesterase
MRAPRLISASEYERASTRAVPRATSSACYHDIGFVVQHADHKAVGGQIAPDTRPVFGYQAAQVEQVIGIIQS